MLLKLVLDFGPIVHVKLFFKAGPSKNVQLIELGLNPQTLVVGPFYLIHVTFVFHQYYLFCFATSIVKAIS